MTQGPRKIQTFRHISRAAKIFLSVFCVMLGGEGLKHLIFPEMNVWASHVSTALLTSIFATFLVSFFLQRREKQIDGTLRRERASFQHSQEALLEGERALQALLNAIQESAFLMDIDGTILESNETLATRFGATRDELIGRNAFSLVSPEIAAQRRAFLERAISSGKPVHFEDVRRGRYIDNTIYPVPEAQGSPNRVAILGIDITDRKHAEQKVQQAQELAENASRMKGQFLSGMSHELRTPLNVIMGSSQNLMRDRQLNPQQHRTLHTIFLSGQCLLEMINELLDTAKIEAGELRLQPNSFHSRDFFDHLAEIIRFQADQKGLKFFYVQDPRLPAFLFADKQRLRRILLQLLSNAINYSEKGHVSLKVLVKPGVKTGRTMLYFQIENTGAGIFQKGQAAMFEAFQPLHGSMPGDEGGGRKLFVTQQLLELMNSELHVQSREGGGNVLSFEIELKNGAAPEPGPEEGLKPDSPILRGDDGERRRILLVDDNKHNRFMLREYLEPFHLTLREASSGQEAIRQTLSFHPDLILMDLVMPDMDGFEATRRIRHSPEGSALKIIAVSASASEHKEKQCLRAGFDAFLAKPIMLKKLTVLLQKHLQRVRPLKEQGETLISRAVHKKPFFLPSRKDLQQLLRLAKRGNPNEISDFLDTLTANEPAVEDFVLECHGLLEQFQIKRLHEKLMMYLGEDYA